MWSFPNSTGSPPKGPLQGKVRDGFPGGQECLHSSCCCFPYLCILLGSLNSSQLHVRLNHFHTIWTFRFRREAVCLRVEQPPFTLSHILMLCFGTEPAVSKGVWILLAFLVCPMVVLGAKVHSVNLHMLLCPSEQELQVSPASYLPSSSSGVHERDYKQTILLGLIIWSWLSVK